MDQRLQTPWTMLRAGIGLTATLAGLDKFFNLLADWGAYVSPLAAQLLPFSTDTFMAIVGVIEVAVGVAILGGWTRLGAYVASAWLLGVAGNLALAGFFDVAVRDVVMALAAFTLARLAEVREGGAETAVSPRHDAANRPRPPSCGRSSPTISSNRSRSVPKPWRRIATPCGSC